MHASHNLMTSGHFVWCSACGAWAQSAKLVGLKEVCPDQAASDGAEEARKRLNRGCDPHSGSASFSDGGGSPTTATYPPCASRGDLNKSS